MKIRVFALLVSLVLTACSGQAPGPGGQPSPGKVTVQVDENRASVTVATATPAAATPSETAVAPSAKATPGDSVDVKIDASGVAVKTQAGGDGATVNITGDGVEIGANSKGQTGSVTLTGNGVQIGTNTSRSEEDTPQQVGQNISIQGAGQTHQFSCVGEAVNVEGASNTVTLTGRVGTLVVNGSSNQVEVENAQLIEVSGTGNKVVWRGSKPEVNISGIDNDVNQASP